MLPLCFADPSRGSSLYCQVEVAKQVSMESPLKQGSLNKGVALFDCPYIQLLWVDYIECQERRSSHIELIEQLSDQFSPKS